MTCHLNSEDPLDAGPVYICENGKLHRVTKGSYCANNAAHKPRPCRLFTKGFSVALCLNSGDETSGPGKKDHFIFTYTREGSLRYSAKSLFNLVLGFISDNVSDVDSLMGFPEQIAEMLFTAAEVRQKFSEPVTGLKSLQKFTAAYGSLVLSSLCLHSRHLVISEKLEEIKSFRELTHLDLSCCGLGDAHELLEHVATLSGLIQLHLKDNCLSNAGLRKMTAPVRVMKQGLQQLEVLDLSCNPKITDGGLTFLFCFSKLNCLDISDTGVKDSKVAVLKIQTRLGLVHSKEPLKEFDHTDCSTKGWAEQMEKESGSPDTHDQRTVPDAEFKASAKLQFYRRAADSSHLVLQNDASANPNPGLQKNKDLGLPKEAQEANKSPDFATQNAARLTAEDWAFLNTY